MDASGGEQQQQARASGEAAAQQPESPQLDAGSAFEQLAAEMQAGGGEEEEDIDARVKRALECPCVAELKEGPCGPSFVDAFTCFLKSTAEEQGSDCIQQFVAMQMCIELHPDQFSHEVKEELSLHDDSEKQQQQGQN